ncbi:NAD(P)-dependent oxidoreductase [Pannonibacter sp. P2PFMT1]|uniref:NAD-dependent epimerase/dehydratase family protein n=1 Tax=Pannonibacter sp. P2PFMT1 TaxID=2003582 RepID=UPI00164587C8|nr:NAD(P)-dependent oxidoreductase [Pannonibacter sp. P2PFMT1]
MDRILITGGSGFIGANVARFAVASGNLVLNLDTREPLIGRSYGSWQAIDIRIKDDVSEVVKDFAPTRIIHLASDTDVSLVRRQDFATTLNGTENVIYAAKSAQQLKSFIHVSTQFVVRPGVVPTSEHHLDPYTVYGEAKAETERMVWRAELTVPWLILRPTIIWGPHHPSFANNIFKYIRNRSYLHPAASSKIMRTFGYVENSAEQIHELSVLAPKIQDKKVFYIGDECLDYDEWTDLFSIGLSGARAKRIPLRLLKALGLAGDFFKFVGLKAPIDSGRVFRMSTSSAIDISSTISTVGAPRIGLEAGVAETLRWLRQEYSEDPSLCL